MDQNFLYGQYHQKNITCSFLCPYLWFHYSFLIYIINTKLLLVLYFCREIVVYVFGLLDILSDNSKHYQLSIMPLEFIKMQAKHRNFLLYRLYFFIKICYNYFCFVVRLSLCFLIVWFYSFITHNRQTVYNTC